MIQRKTLPGLDDVWAAAGEIVEDQGQVPCPLVPTPAWGHRTRLLLQGPHLRRCRVEGLGPHALF